jgi:adenine-specific DNA-methyltransferase
MNSLQLFNTESFINALKAFFIELKVPVDYLADEPASPADILGERFKATNEVHQLIADVYALGLVNDGIFEGTTTFNDLAQVKKLTTDYDGLLIFGITLNSRPDGLLPTRSQLAEITRIFNRVFPYTPVTIVFKYDTYISFANSERVKYLQEWREGEKIGKVSLLRDINFTHVHAGHYRILKDLAIARTGKNAINSFSELYKYWQSTLSVSILNKAFYGELQNWYFWAIQEVHFPNPPLRIDFNSDNDFDEAIKEHKGKNVIRLLTRILFIWFIKEKGLIPEEIFDEKTIANQILDEFVPQKPEGLFATGKQNSKYYRAILQNLFFATLNQPCKKREFRAEGKHQNVTQLMRYKSYFKDADYFVGLMEAKVPFMNGGLFECLDKPHPTAKGKQGGDRIIYVDGFSDRAENDILVPDYLFFDADEEVDLSNELGNNKAKNSKTRGLIAILKSYKFTITENTPIDEDVALDPELLGKVFENLLASYNPETKTTARKQTGSFYTPREIVDYMVDESLIAYLKNHISAATEKLDEQLHQLVSYSSINPFSEDEATQKAIIKSLDKCTILDPACGSGAYPMGILQKMVHILHKIDPNNTEWKNRQLRRVDNAIAELEQLEDNTLRESTIRELELQKNDIEESFANNELDYGRKLYLIENCIFGVDIQPIATQISKLRFFISLVVDQKVDAAKDNFGVRPLPNLETKFVAANTLIGIDKPKNAQTYLFDRTEVQKLEKDLKKVRQRLFSAKTPSTKRSLREQDKDLRERMGDLLIEEYGNATARQLANWDPYDQNTTSPFFDKEWMFDIKEGFDIVIGNPPYVDIKSLPKEDVKIYFQIFKTAENRINLYSIFIEKGISLLKNEGNLIYINPNSMLVNESYKKIRLHLIEGVEMIIKLPDSVFESATVETIILQTTKVSKNNFIKGKFFAKDDKIDFNNLELNIFNRQEWKNDNDLRFNIFSDDETSLIVKKIENKTSILEDFVKFSLGITPYDKYKGHSEQLIKNREYHSFSKETDFHVPLISGKNIQKYIVSDGINEYLKYGDWLGASRERKFFDNNKIIIRQILSGDNLNIVAAYSEEPHFFTQIGFSLISKRNNDKELKYLIAIVNSKLMSFYHKCKFLDKEKVVFQKILIANCKQLPIKQLSPESQQPFIDLVDKILAGKQAGEDTQTLEAEIDLRVYKLYELTHAEVLVIDPNFGLSAGEYELLAY